MKSTETNPSTPQSDPEPPRPEPAYEDPRNAAPQELGRPWQMWLTIGAASIPSALSLAFTVATIQEIVGGWLGLAIGLVVDALIIATVVIAWANPAVRVWASAFGWLGAVGAAVLLGHHHWGTEEVAFAAGPIISKVLWTLALMALTAREKAQAAVDEARRTEEEADDSSLTVEQRKTLAQLENEALFAEAEAAAKVRRDDARAKADSDTKIAQAKREMEERLARMDVTEVLRTRKAEMEERLELLSSPRRMITLGSGSYAPDDASSLGDTPPPAGFGSALRAQAHAAQAPTVRTPAEEQVRTPAQTPPRGGARVSAEEAAVRRALVWETRDRLIEETGEEPSINALSLATGLHRRTVKRHLEADN